MNSIFVYIYIYIQSAAERRTRHRAWPKTYTNNNKSIKQLSTFNPKSIKKRSQIHQQLTKNRLKSLKNRYWRLSGRFGLKMAIFKGVRGRLGRYLGCVLGRPGGVLGGCRPCLGTSWGVLGRLGGVLGGFGACLGASWGDLGPLGGVLGLIFKQKEAKLRHSILDGIF